MPAPVKPIPDGYHAITPYLIISGAAAAIDFYKRAFGATEVLRMPDPSGQKIGHAELKIGDASFMLADEYPDMGHRSPASLGGTPVFSCWSTVENVDQVVAQGVGHPHQRAAARGRPVLRRPRGHGRRPLRPCLEHRHPRRRRAQRRAAAKSGGGV